MTAQEEIDLKINNLLSEIKNLSEIKSQLRNDINIKYIRGWTFEKQIFSPSIGYYYIAKINLETKEVVWIRWRETDKKFCDGGDYKINQWIAKYDSDITNLISSNKEATEIEFLTHYDRADQK